MWLELFAGALVCVAAVLCTVAFRCASSVRATRRAARWVRALADGSAAGFLMAAPPADAVPFGPRAPAAGLCFLDLTDALLLRDRRTFAVFRADRCTAGRAAALTRVAAAWHEQSRFDWYFELTTLLGYAPLVPEIEAKDPRLSGRHRRWAPSAPPAPPPDDDPGDSAALIVAAVGAVGAEVWRTELLVAGRPALVCREAVGSDHLTALVRRAVRASDIPFELRQTLEA